MNKIAIVIPWFGKDLKGGAEQQAYQIAVRLNARRKNVEILTTCCKSFHDDWAINHYQAGTSDIEGLSVRRFPVDLRDSLKFDLVNRELLDIPKDKLIPGVSPVLPEKSSIFVEENIKSLSLQNFIVNNRDDYSAFILLPYLYGVIIKGVHAALDKAYLQPCLHDECYAYLPEIADIFCRAKGILLNSEGEKLLAQNLFGPGINNKCNVVGEGVEFNSFNKLSSLARHFLDKGIEEYNYILSLGRRDPAKNTDFLVKVFSDYKKRYPLSKLKLVLAGPGTHSYANETADVYDFGLVSEDEKNSLLKYARVLCQPSLNESYSRVIMESWLAGRPILVNGTCLATSMAVQDSGGGWISNSEQEWIQMLSVIDSTDNIALSETGIKGKEYAEKFADWERVIDHYEEIFIDAVPLKSDGSKKRCLKEIHQLLPNITFGDAISNYAIFIRDLLRERGYKSEILVQYFDEFGAQNAQVYDKKKLNKKTAIIYHHSIGSDLTELAKRFQGPKYLIYHNITPSKFYQPYRQDFASILEKGIQELADLKNYFEYSSGDSTFNANDLHQRGFRYVDVLPIAIDPAKWCGCSDNSLISNLSNGRKNIIFVGRISPNKCQDQIVQVFEQILLMEKNARLYLIGYADVHDPYYLHLQSIIEKKHLNNYIQITGPVSDDQLYAYYKTAALFLSMSEHEGFCVPLIEAMWFDVPVIAYKSSAIPETLGDAGLMFTTKKDLTQIAALCKLMISDKNLRQKLLCAQRKRREYFLPESLKHKFDNVIAILEKMNS